MQTKLGIAKLLQNFKLSPCSKTPIPMKLSPRGQVQSPEGGMWLKVEKIMP
jgi:cytochrome P450 family 6